MSRALQRRERDDAGQDAYDSRRLPRAAAERARVRQRGAAGGPSILDAPPLQNTPRATVAGGLGSVAFHLGLIGLAIHFAALHPKQPPHNAPVTQLFDVAIQPPEPPPTPEPPPPAAEPEPPPPPTPKLARAPKPTPTPPPPSAAEPPPAKTQEPPPAAAETGKLLEAAAPIDFGDQFVAGNANQFAGGVSAAAGTAKQAVHDSRAQAQGVPGGTGTGPDRSRAPQLADGLRWDIPFPVEADDDAVDHAKVTLRVSVAADGRVSSVTVLSDPGFGFGREARRFALTRRWSAGLDRGGNPISTTTTVNVRFDR